MTTRKYNAEALEARGQRMFPTAYTPIESQWALVHSSH